jgi:poly(3-hydroxybutyrate) depolymerase
MSQKAADTPAGAEHLAVPTNQGLRGSWVYRGMTQAASGLIETVKVKRTCRKLKDRREFTDRQRRPVYRENGEISRAVGVPVAKTGHETLRSDAYIKRLIPGVQLLGH